jgi:hypothetical protein
VHPTPAEPIPARIVTMQKTQVAGSQGICEPPRRKVIAGFPGKTPGQSPLFRKGCAYRLRFAESPLLPVPQAFPSLPGKKALPVPSRTKRYRLHGRIHNNERSVFQEKRRRKGFFGMEGAKPPEVFPHLAKGTESPTSSTMSSLSLISRTASSWPIRTPPDWEKPRGAGSPLGDVRILGSYEKLTGRFGSPRQIAGR